MAEEKEKKESPNLDDVFDESEVTGDEEDSKRSSRRYRRRKPVDLKCPLCESGVKYVTYKDIYQLKKFTSVRGKIISSEKSGVCAKHQRQLSKAIKKARYMGLMPYVAIED